MIIKPFLRFIAPYECAGCRAEGTALCSDCRATRVARKVSACFACNKLSTNFETCANCYRKHRIKRVVVAARYDDLVRELILRLKYGYSVDLAQPLGELLLDRLCDIDVDLVMPVPSTNSARHERGFNNAELIAKYVSSKIDVPLLDALSRFGVSRQVGTRRRERLMQPRQTMYVRSHAALIKNARILLIDDVVTTGATLAEAARALRAAGARSVEAAVVAKH